VVVVVLVGERAFLMALMALRRCDMAASARDGSDWTMRAEAE
jgi:hypothetical protein